MIEDQITLTTCMIEDQIIYLICRTMRKQRNCTESDVNFIVHKFFKLLTRKIETNVES